MKSKRENLLSPSSSWRENSHSCVKSRCSRSSADGCLPGFFHLFFSKLHFTSNRRKSLTFGSKNRQHTLAVSTPSKEANDDDDGRSLGGEVPPMVSPRINPPHPYALPAETRSNLLGALEKCDRDLAALQRTIDAIKTSFVLHHHKLSGPASLLLDDFKCRKIGEVILQQQNQTQKKKTAAAAAAAKEAGDITTTHMGKPNVNVNVININTNYTMKRTCPTVRTVSKSMVESVNQVCRDVAWGERREAGKIGLALHDHICRDLIEETVKELSGECIRHVYALPLDACRRRLVF